MSLVLNRWKVVVDFVQGHDVSDISLWGENLTARMDGQIVSLAEAGALSKQAVSEMIRELLMINPERARAMDQPMISVDFTVELFDKRFRVNVARTRGELFASLRPLPENPPEPSTIGLSSPLVKSVREANGGLVLITGPTGSGKTTTIASLLETINRSRQAKIITIEDPIEFNFTPVKAEIIQREIGLDSRSYEQGLREALRQNPDVIVIGEIRDAETSIVALQAAETGHLVIGSLHANSVVEAITRYLLLGPKERSLEMRYVLAKTLRVVTNQRLLRKRGGGRIAVREVCLHAPNVEAVILRGNEHELAGYMLTGRESGMIDFLSALKSVQHLVEPSDYQLFSKL
ncbi:MAG TPA: ATPase, T2SS/T4P/T4SS family [Chthoniobacterales bacterium]|jgi:twitching motility protein PilT|nr:ATPase, T2SS/T4P/T4SS family [Chthoniobacterales bacterium]